MVDQQAVEVGDQALAQPAWAFDREAGPGQQRRQQRRRGAFHFISAPDACPSSVTAYDWGRVHQASMARLGVHTEWYECGYEATFELARTRAVATIKASIDRGHPVIVWAPTAVLEFGLLSGYDDADGVFEVAHAAPGPADPLLYGNLGRKRVPWLAYQVFVDCAAPDPDLRARLPCATHAPSSSTGTTRGSAT